MNKPESCAIRARLRSARSVPNPDSEVESEFEERNIELEEWLGEWMEKELGEAARELFSNEA